MTDRSNRVPLFSVIIPTFDRLPMLQEAVQSVRQQTEDRWELLVVDDGSTDGTDRWLRTQPDIRPLGHSAPRGPSAARNLGAAHARGEYLAFLDSDDLFLPHKLELQAAALAHDPGAPLCHGNELWRRNGKELRQKKKHEKRGGRIFSHCLPMCRISPSASVIQRRCFEELGGFDEDIEIAEDYELWLRLTCRHRVSFVPRPVIIKRGGHPDQLSEKYGQIEKFRIEALRRVIARAPLDADQRAEARETLRTKCEIYALGCLKRGRPEEAARYRQLPEEMEQGTYHPPPLSPPLTRSR